MKIVFMGTPVFAVRSLRALIDNGYEIAGVFTRPDKPKNRGQKLQMTPVKEMALDYGIVVHQPLSLKNGESAQDSYELLKTLNPDCIVVAAYGQILPKSILEMPKYGCINVHASLLPKYRGASPINTAVINGEKESGISVMYMAEGLDCGDVILTAKTPITEDMNATALHDKLSAQGAEALITALKLIEEGKAVRVPQDNAAASYAPMITKESCRINWSAPAGKILNHIRGLSESPGAYTFLDGKRLKIYSAALCEIQPPGGTPGTVTDDASFSVLCGDKKLLLLTDVQLEGGKRMSSDAFLRGKKLSPQTILG